MTIHANAAQSDHVHVVITAIREGEQLRDVLKATATRRCKSNEAGKRDLGTATVRQRNCLRPPRV